MKGNVMKLALIIATTILLSLGAVYLWFGVNSSASKESGQGNMQLYTCGMHPEIISAEPGVCPICNMNLTPKRDGGNSNGGITINPTVRQNMGLATVPAVMMSLTRTVHAFGQVAIPDRNRHMVRLKISGWIERLFVNEEGAQVFKGAPLLEIYSPELVTAQKEYLAAAENANRSDQLMRFMQLTEERLRNWDIPGDQIAKLKTSGEISRTMLIRAPVDGFVMHKHVDIGDQVTPQITLYEIADLKTVWVTAYVYEQDIPHIALKQEALIRTPGLPGEEFSSRVAYVSPILNAGSQVEIRLEFDNPDFRLRPEMYAEIDIKPVQTTERLAIPRSAVINSGARQLVYVASDNDSFEPRPVTTGIVDGNDMIEILNGLVAGELVVISGQFLLDSESRLSEAITPTDGHQHDHDDIHQAEPKQHAGYHRDMKTSDDPYDIHTCPMPVHYHVLNYGPGTCSECGMELVPVTETDNHDVFVCPMPQCGVAQPDSGVCSVCNMNLVKYLPERDS